MKKYKGWMEKTQRAKSWSELPALAIKFVRIYSGTLIETMFRYCQQI